MTMAVEDPGRGCEVAVVADAGPEDALAALAAADIAGRRFGRSDHPYRQRLLRRASSILRERQSRFAATISVESGKPPREAVAEVRYASAYLDHYAALSIPHHEAATKDETATVRTQYRPVGPSLLITPWNFPLAIVARKAAAAIAAGCTIVIKPAPETPLSALVFAEALADAGAPPGVVNVVTASDAATCLAPLLSDARLRKISFTGSTAVGRRLIEQSATTVARLSLELGGNAPFIVLADADVDTAVEGAVLAKMRNAGQACTAANRFYVHEAVYERFVAKLADAMSRLQAGHWLEPDAEVGPLITAAQRSRVQELIDDAVARGARVVTGATTPDRDGHFLEPTVLVDVPRDARCWREEIFGPVAAIAPFTEIDDAVADANDSEYGLAAYVYGSDTAATTVAYELDVGMVGVNRGSVSDPAVPFGGTRASGYGREGGPDGLRDFLEPLAVIS